MIYFVYNMYMYMWVEWASLKIIHFTFKKLQAIHVIDHGVKLHGNGIK